MSSKRSRTIFARAVLLAAASLAGCHSDDAGQAQRALPLGEQVVGWNWVLYELENRSIGRASPPAATVIFGRDGSISGAAPCNQGGAPLNWRDGAFYRPANQDRVPVPVFTLMGCLDRQASETGNGFWLQMLGARGWTLAGETVAIQFADGTAARLRRAPNAVNSIAPQSAAGANFTSGEKLAHGGAGDIGGLNNRQLIAMFGQAVAQQAPLSETMVGLG
jgi:hypothetical protein